MKLRILLLTILVSPIFNIDVKSQDQKSVGLITTYSGLLNGAIISPAYILEKANKNLYIGPTLLWSIGDQQESRDKLKLTGIQGTYQYIPFRNDGKTTLYIQGDLILQRIRDKGTSVLYNANTASFDPFEFTKTDNLVQLYFGYGLIKKLGERYALSQSIGLGIVYNSRSTKSGFEDFTDQFFDTDWMIKIGITRSI